MQLVPTSKKHLTLFSWATSRIVLLCVGVGCLDKAIHFYSDQRHLTAVVILCRIKLRVRSSVVYVTDEFVSGYEKLLILKSDFLFCPFVA